jgi:surface protein
MVTGVSSIYIGSDTRDANATVKDLMLNKTAYSNEIKLTGTHNIEKDLNTNIFKTFTLNLDQSALANYYLQELANGTLLTANLYGFIGHLKELNSVSLPKNFMMVSPNTAPYLIIVQAGNDNYIYFDTNYTAGFTQFDSIAGTGFVNTFLTQTGLTQAQLNSLSGWYNANTLQAVTNPITLNDLLIEEAFTSTVGDFIQNGQNFHYTSMQINLDDSLYNVSYTKFDGITEAQDIKDVFNVIVNNSYLNNATATAEDIAQGKIAFIQGGKVTGIASGGGDYNVLLDLSASDSGTGDILKKLITEINMPNGFDASYFTTLANFFEACRNLVNFPRIINSGNITVFTAMFRYCSSMVSIDNFDTSSGIYFSEMFRECTSLTTAPSINLQNGTNLLSMFQGCSNLTNVPQYNTSNATTMNAMFNSCSKLVTIPQFGTSKVTDFSYMFSYCGNLQNVPVLSFAAITNSNTLSSMFTSCSKLTNESLNNILATCLTATNLSSGKTLRKLGLSKTQCTTCTTLSKWAELEAAGWTTGY